MSNKIKDLPSHLWGIIRENSKKIIISFVTIVFFIIMFISCNNIIQNIKIKAYQEAIVAQEKFEANIIDSYIDKLIEQGYENVSAELSWIIQFAKNNNIPIINNNIRLEESLENIIINRYDYYAEYKTITIKNKTYFFKSQNEANNFLEQIKKYDNSKYEIKNIKDLIGKESKQEDLNAVISAKKQAAAKRQTTLSNGGNSNYNISEYQSYAYDLVINQYNWTEADFNALVKLWERESGWNPNSHNSSSGAHGIPQALPASKMASEGADYYTNGYTQIRWGLKYIQQRYGSPNKAWNHFQQKGWY